MIATYLNCELQSRPHQPAQNSVCYVHHVCNHHTLEDVVYIHCHIHPLQIEITCPCSSSFTLQNRDKQLSQPAKQTLTCKQRISVQLCSCINYAEQCMLVFEIAAWHLDFNKRHLHGTLLLLLKQSISFH